MAKKPKLYWVWSTMIQRCHNHKNKHFIYYGGRGIQVCSEWRTSSVFIEWALSNGYAPGLCIDRIDNDKGYFPDNCRFVTQKENNSNKRRYKCTGRFIGVSERTYFGKAVTTTTYRARINHNGMINIAEFNNPIDAAVARDSYVLNNNLMRDLNFPQPLTEIS